MTNLKEEWKMFLRILLEPLASILIVCIVFLVIFSRWQIDPIVLSLLFVLIAVASGVLGARIDRKLTAATEGSIIAARGKSAVRNLKLLLRHISTLKQKVIKFTEEAKEDSIVFRNYEEIRSFCGFLEEESVNSIENWTDILPEADVTTQIGKISELTQSLEVKEEELDNLRKENSLEKDRSEEENKQLGIEIKEKELQIKNLEKEIIQKQVGFDSLNALSAYSTGLGHKSSIARPLRRGLIVGEGEGTS